MGLKLDGSRLLGALALSALSAGVAAQTATLTADDYAKAERFMSYRTAPLVDHAIQSVTWLDDGHFWYRDHDAQGDHYLRMDAATGKAEPAFDQAKLAAALGKATGKPVDAAKLGITEFDVAADGQLDVSLRGKHYLCDLKGEGVCAPPKHADAGDEPGVLSPDKTTEAFIRHWNLWLRDAATGKETQLTTDGVEDYGYATDNAGWKHTDNAILVW